ncbi:MAG TPA: hypothetical protein VFA45_17400 [Actinomycetes bacterium]|jgi:hypothetical protein|nr:hypothetical protein [Actinomycetes bacterium]
MSPSLAGETAGPVDAHHELAAPGDREHDVAAAASRWHEPAPHGRDPAPGRLHHAETGPARHDGEHPSADHHQGRVGRHQTRAAGFSVTGAQAQQIAVVVAFLDADDAGQLQAALSSFATNAIVSDCDYRAAKDSDFHGRAEIAGWLRARMADHDHLTPAHLFNNNPDQPVGVIGIQYQRRTSDTLRSLGFPTGIRPNIATKVIFTADDHIQSFANGPFGGPSEPCRPA